MIVHDPVSFFSCQSLNPDKCLADIEITEQIIIDSIQELSSTSAARPDGVPSSLLLKCAAELAPALKVMFSQSLTHTYLLTYLLILFIPMWDTRPLGKSRYLIYLYSALWFQ